MCKVFYMTSYKDLIVWQKSFKLVKSVYNLTRKFPREERYGITSQVCRAAISIPSNIAEGYCRKHKQEYIQFLRIAFSSGAELETQLMLSKDLKFAPENEIDKVYNELTEVMKMLNKLISSLNPRP